MIWVRGKALEQEAGPPPGNFARIEKGFSRNDCRGNLRITERERSIKNRTSRAPHPKKFGPGAPGSGGFESKTTASSTRMNVY